MWAGVKAPILPFWCVGDLIVNKYSADACRWIGKADVAKWVPERHVKSTLNCLMEVKAIVLRRFGGRAIAAPTLNANDLVILSQADEYQGSFHDEILWKVVELRNEGSKVKIVRPVEVGTPAEVREVKVFECTLVECCGNVPIGIVEQTSINLEDFVMPEYEGKTVKMSQATVKDIHRAILCNGLWRRAAGRDNDQETNWRKCVWNKRLLPKLQVFLYRLRTGSLFCGARMRGLRAHAGQSTSCIRGCGEMQPDRWHDLHSCPLLANLMDAAVTIGGWLPRALPMESLWKIERGRRSKEKQEEEERTRANTTAILYVAYMDLMRYHFEENVSDGDRIGLLQSSLLKLAKEIRLFQASDDTIRRCSFVEATARAMLAGR